ncbi:MAG: ATP-dependent helicase [Flavobacteriaceae bacterium]
MAVLGVFMDLKDHVCGDIDSFTSLPEIHNAFEELKRRRSPIKSINTFVFKILNQMASPEVGLLKKDIFFSAFVSPKKARDAFTHIRKLEDRLIILLREEDPDANTRCLLHLTRVNERLCREGIDCLPEYLERIIGFLKDDWQKLTRGIETFDFKRRNSKQYDLFINKDWDSIIELIQTRVELCGEILNFIIGSSALGPNDRAQELVAFPETDLLDHLKADLYSSFAKIPDLGEAVHYALLWLNENKVIELQNGKALITSAMTIYLKRSVDRGGRMRRYVASDYDALKCFYEEKKLQIHVVGKYARIGIEQEDGHTDFISDYFDLDGSEFVEKYFKGEEELLKLSTGIESYKAICESLNNKTQEGIVRADSYSNHMVLAGPGSGKSRVIAHRCGWLLRGLRVNSGSIVVLCFNRHAALELRRRIWKLVGADARGVIIQTFHGLALRLLGRTMARLDSESAGEPMDFEGIIPEAIKHLNGEKVLPGMEAEDFRRKLLGNLTHILVDEYQDITGEAYELVCLLAGKAQEGIENRLNILAVGDDDQSIYKFAGANVEFIRRFQEDFTTRDGKDEIPVTFHELVDNYRSTRNIIHSANMLIDRNHDRMKQTPIQIDKMRAAYPEGGALEGFDKIAKGKVQVLSIDGETEQVVACIGEMKRYLGLTDRHRLENCCIIGRTNKELIPMRLGFEKAGIACRIVGSDPMPNLSRIREVYLFLALLKEHESEIWTAEQLMLKLKEFLGSKLTEQPAGQMLLQIAGEWYGETGGFEQPCSAIIDFFYDALHEQQRLGGQSSGVSICTAHKAKGMEFDCVFILDGGWNSSLSDSAKLEEERRLLYVAMTRARQNLMLFQRKDRPNPFIRDFRDERVLERQIKLVVPEANDLLMNIDAIELEDLYISFSANMKPSSHILSTLQHLGRRDPLKFVESTFNSQSVIEVQTQTGICVTRLSHKGYEKLKPKLDKIDRIVTSGLHIRTREDGNKMQDTSRDFWEIPIFEVYWSDYDEILGSQADSR